jgi:hypothetical protein
MRAPSLLQISDDLVCRRFGTSDVSYGLLLQLMSSVPVQTIRTQSNCSAAEDLFAVAAQYTLESESSAVRDLSFAQMAKSQRAKDGE